MISVMVGIMTVAVGVSVSSPVTGIPGSAVRVAAATVCATAVLMTSRSGDGWDGAQAARMTSSMEPIKRFSFRIVFGIFPPFCKACTRDYLLYPIGLTKNVNKYYIKAVRRPQSVIFPDPPRNFPHPR
jgi:hypothetical protein